MVVPTGLNTAWFFTFGLALAAFHIAFATLNAITLALLPLRGSIDLALVNGAILSWEGGGMTTVRH